MKDKRRFNTNAYLTAATRKLIIDENIGETKNEIIEEARDIFSYIFEDIGEDSVKDEEKLRIGSGFLQSKLDPGIFQYINSTDIEDDNYIEIVRVTDKLLGPTFEIDKMDMSMIEKINKFKILKKKI